MHPASSLNASFSPDKAGFLIRLNMHRSTNSVGQIGFGRGYAATPTAPDLG